MATEAASIYPSLENRPVKGTICLFDVDETLTPARSVCLDPLAALNFPSFANCRNLLLTDIQFCERRVPPLKCLSFSRN